MKLGQASPGEANIVLGVGGAKRCKDEEVEGKTIFY